MRQIIKDYLTSKIFTGKPSVDFDEDTDLVRGGLVDSVTMIRLVEFIEDEFDIEVPFEDFTIKNFSSINVILSYLETQTQRS
jgi:acyl carrier protein